MKWNNPKDNKLLFKTPQVLVDHNLLPDCGYVKLYEAHSCAWRGSPKWGSDSVTHLRDCDIFGSFYGQSYIYWYMEKGKWEKERNCD